MREDLLPRRTPAGVQFTFCGPATLTSVAVAGTFNSWVGEAAPLTRLDAVTWQITLPIAPGRHLYKYVLDQREWVLDPANPWVSEDGQNNSCFTVNERGEVLHRLGPFSSAAPGDLYRRHSARPSPAWLGDAVVYQLSVPAFGGDFAGTRRRLDHLSALGVNVVWIMPVHPVGGRGRIGRRGDPYAVRDFTALDPALGDRADFLGLVRDLHGRGMRVILDWTLNRSSCDNPLIDVHPDWFTRDARGRPYYAVPNRDSFTGFNFANRDLRAYLLRALQGWVTAYDLDGFRFDDSDLTPLDFLLEIREALELVRPEIGLISQAYDELHHLAACDLTYEGGTREMLHRLAAGAADDVAFAQAWETATYSFPRGALRLRWLEEKEQGRAFRYFGAELHRVAASVLMTLDGVPMLLMGQEFNEPGWQNWTSLFDDFALAWEAFDEATFRHYQALIDLRRRYPALRQGPVRFELGVGERCLRYWRGAGAAQLVVTVNASADWREVAPPAGEAVTVYQQGGGAPTRLAPYGSVIQHVRPPAAG